jgi:hypothetical protein
VLDHSGQFGQSENTVARQVADMRDADERQQVVLADRAERDAAREDELVVALVVGERRQVERARAEQLGVGTPSAPGGSWTTRRTEVERMNESSATQGGE